MVRNLEDKRALGRPKRRWRIIYKLIFGKYGERMWIGFVWLMIGIVDRLL